MLPELTKFMAQNQMLVTLFMIPAMGLAMSAGAGVPLIVAAGLATGLICGAINGLLVARMGLPSIVVTIGTMSLFRGLSFVILGDKAFTGYPASFSWFGQGYVWWVFSFEFCLFLVLAVVYGIVLHKTSFGRTVYAIGNNPTAALFSGAVSECQPSSVSFSPPATR